MAKLTKKARAKIPADKFAGPGRSLPVEDRKHARAAIVDIGSAPAGSRATILRKAKAELKRTDQTP
jgi:hypothetical protein